MPTFQPDDIILSKPKRELHPAGSFAALCVDLIDLGMRVQEYQGKTSASQSCVLVFGTGETDSKGFELFPFREFNVSMGTRSKLRAFLETWRGKAFSAEEAQGFALKALVGKPAMLTVAHATSKAGNDYSKLEVAAPMPKGMLPPVVGKYERAAFWEARKAEYASDYQKFIGSGVPKGDASYHGPITDSADDDSSVPF